MSALAFCQPSAGSLDWAWRPPLLARSRTPESLAGQAGQAVNGEYDNLWGPVGVNH